MSVTKKKIDKNVQTRVAFMKGVKTITNDVKEVYDNYNEEEHLEFLQGSLEYINIQLERIRIIQDNVIDMVAEDRVEYEVMEMINFEQYVNKELLVLKKFIDKHCQSKDDHVSLSPVSSSECTRVMKLPKLEIKPFKGDPTTWQSFYDSFDCAVHRNESLSGVQKMNYLMNLLVGQVAESVKGLTLSNDNYEIALNILKERYGDNQVVISAHMNNLLSMDPVKSISDVKSLRKLCDIIKSQIRGLNCIGIEAKNYGPLLIPVVLSKVPDEIKLVVSRKFGKDIWDAENFLGTFESELHTST